MEKYRKEKAGDSDGEIENEYKEDGRAEKVKV